MKQQQVIQKKQKIRQKTAQHTRKSQVPGQIQDHPYLQAQGIIGNHGVLRRHPGIIQAKLKVSSPGDKYEQEADRLADQVMRMPEPGLQRQPEEEEEEEELIQTRPIAGQITPLIQRQEENEEEKEEEEEEEELIQPKTVSGRRAEVTPDVRGQINAMKGGGHPLPESTRAFFEQRFGHDFSRVRFHTDSRGAEAAREVKARAFTVGRDVVFGTGQYAPETQTGRYLLAHELAHTVQNGGSTSTATHISQPDNQWETDASKAASGVVHSQPYQLKSGAPVGVYRQHTQESIPGAGITPIGKRKLDIKVRIFKKIGSKRLRRSLSNVAPPFLRGVIGGIQTKIGKDEGSFILNRFGIAQTFSPNGFLYQTGFAIGAIKEFYWGMYQMFLSLPQLLKEASKVTEEKILTRIEAGIDFLVSPEAENTILRNGRTAGIKYAKDIKKIARKNYFTMGYEVGRIFGPIAIEIVLSFVTFGGASVARGMSAAAKISRFLSRLSKTGRLQRGKGGVGPRSIVQRTRRRGVRRADLAREKYIRDIQSRRRLRKRTRKEALPPAEGIPMKPPRGFRPGTSAKSYDDPSKYYTGRGEVRPYRKKVKAGKAFEEGWGAYPGSRDPEIRYPTGRHGPRRFLSRQAQFEMRPRWARAKLKKSLGPASFRPSAAHHIIPFQHRYHNVVHEATVYGKWGGINNAQNGIYLPTRPNVTRTGRRSIHAADNFHKKYNDKMLKALDKIEKLDKFEDRMKAFRSLIRKTRKQLMKGELVLD